MAYCVYRQSNRDGGESIIARSIETHGEAAEIALRLIRLQEEIGGMDRFSAEPE